jgi:transposase
MSEDVIHMSRTEIQRLHIIRRVLEKRLSQRKASELMDLTDRQVRRLVGRIRDQGDEGVIHRSRGKPSSRKIPDTKQRQILKVIRSRYKDFGPTLAVEKLWEYEGIKVSRETVRQWMILEGLWRVRDRRRQRIYQWRERKPHRGEMIQMDGSHHDWLEGRGPELVLMGYVDDATNDFFGRFYGYEGVYPAMESFRCYIRRYGLPVSVYLDRHSTYKTTREPSVEESLRGERAQTQFARALKELGVKLIYAHSPQAKGRIERIFETLQDRLVKEMRLAGINTEDAANRFLETYLPGFNHQFGRIPLTQENLHRSIPKGFCLEDIFCLKETRLIARDYTVRWKSRTFRIQKPSLTLKRQRLCVMEQFDGTIRMKFNCKTIPFIEVTHKIPQLTSERPTPLPKEPFTSRRPWLPPIDHPWRRRFLAPKPKPHWSEETRP